MTQQILFLIVVLIGAYYARKYGNKAKRDIEKYKENNEQDSIKNKPDWPDCITSTQIKIKIRLHHKSDFFYYNSYKYHVLSD